jgi:hypothetical protein
MRYLIIFLTLFLFIACESDSTSANNDAVHQDRAEQAAEAAGESATLMDEVESDIETVEMLDDVELNEVEQSKLGKFASDFQDIALVHKTAETPLYKKGQKVLQKGILDDFNIYLIYDEETGFGELYRIHTVPEMAFRALLYDSSMTLIDMKFTPEDLSDDEFKEHHVYRRYDSSIMLETFVANYYLNEVDQYDRPIDYDADFTSTYQDGAAISQIEKSIERNSDFSGRFYRKITRDDQTYSEFVRTFNGDGTGSWTRTLPSGIEVNGTFNVVRDDLDGGYTRDVTLPAGFFFSAISAVAEFELDTLNHVLKGSITKIYTYSTGGSDTFYVDIHREFEEYNYRVRETSITLLGTTGVESDLLVSRDETGGKLSGSWKSPSGRFSTFDGYRYAGNMGFMGIFMYASESAYDDGANPLVTTQLETFPGSGGLGTITIGDETYTFTFDSSGRLTLRRLGQILRTIELHI